MKAKVIIFVILMIGILNFLIFHSVNLADSKKVLMVIANQGFRDEEFKIPYQALKDKGYEIVIASSMLSTAKGMLGMSVEPDILLVAARPSDYDAVIFVGGIGAQKLWDDADAQEIAKSMNNDGKVVAAICLAPVILANAGILEGRKATVWQSESHKLEFKGANYTGNALEVDGNIITADGPLSTEEFTEAVINKLEE